MHDQVKEAKQTLNNLGAKMDRLLSLWSSPENKVSIKRNKFHFLSSAAKKIKKVGGDVDV
jgi:hypothetical protein